MGNVGEYPYPDGESFLDVQKRATPALDALLEKHRGQTIAVVAHNVVNRAYLAGKLHIPIQYARPIVQKKYRH